MRWLYWAFPDPGDIRPGLEKAIGALLLAAAGLAAVAYLATAGVRTISVARAGEEARARVLHTFEYEREGRGGKVAQVQVAEYEFFYEGQRFLGTSEDWWSEGDELTVMFNPDNPSQNRADGIGPLIADYLRDVFLLGLFAFYAIKGSFPVAVARWLTPRTWWVSREVEGVTIEWLQIPGVEERPS